METQIMNDQEIKIILENTKTIAMIGISSEKKKEDPKKIKRKPANIVMKYMQEFGYKVIPINPFAEGEIINGEKVVSGLDKIAGKIDIVDVFRPSVETPEIAEQAVRIGAKVLWLQYGIHHDKAEEIAIKENIKLAKKTGNKLTQNIIHRYKFYNTEVDNIEHLQHEVITFLLSKIHLFDESKGTKAYSYFVLVTSLSSSHPLKFSQSPFMFPLIDMVTIPVSLQFKDIV